MSEYKKNRLINDIKTPIYHYLYHKQHSNMSRARAYRSIEEIMDIFKITSGTVKSIIKKHKIDSFVSGRTQINTKDFYQVYVTYYNPSLFESGSKKRQTGASITKKDNSDIFQKLFGNPYKNVKKKVVIFTPLMTVKYCYFGKGSLS